jgi:hypothetical protein
MASKQDNTFAADFNIREDLDPFGLAPEFRDHDA